MKRLNFDPMTVLVVVVALGLVLTMTTQASVGSEKHTSVSMLNADAPAAPGAEHYMYTTTSAIRR
jgi:hypothetical protein